MKRYVVIVDNEAHPVPGVSAKTHYYESFEEAQAHAADDAKHYGDNAKVYIGEIELVEV